MSQKPTSTKTRIKTGVAIFFSKTSTGLKNQLPQKQGLRRKKLLSQSFKMRLKNQLPQKQGLRLFQILQIYIT